jgi:CO/xanthine dehydrogenase Mo-binding subunit
MFAIETALVHAAEQLGCPVDELREANFYAEEGDRWVHLVFVCSF